MSLTIRTRTKQFYSIQFKNLLKLELSCFWPFPYVYTLNWVLWVFVFPGPRSFSWHPAPGPGPQFVFTGLGPQFVFTSPGPQFVFTGPGLQFYYQSGAWVCTYQPCLLNLYLYLQPWPTICITSSGPEFAFILLLVAVVVIIVVAVISLEPIIPVFVWRFYLTGENKLNRVCTQSAK